MFVCFFFKKKKKEKENSLNFFLFVRALDIMQFRMDPKLSFETSNYYFNIICNFFFFFFFCSKNK